MISVIIPNYNGETILQKTLAENLKILKEKGISDIILVDDASTDHSVSIVKSKYPEVTLIKKETNSGFGSTVNVGVKYSKHPILFLLNSDMIIRKLDTEKIEATFKDETCFSLTPTILRVTDSNKAESICVGRFQGGFFDGKTINHQTRNIDIDKGVHTLWANGGGSFISKEKYQQLGGMDPLYDPYYFEDLDLSYQAWKRGWHCMFSNSGLLYHYHQSTISTTQSTKKITTIYNRNRYIFMWKNFTDTSYLFSHFFSVLIKILTLQLADIRYIYLALKRMPEILKKRKENKPYIIKKDRDILKPFLSYYPPSS